MITVYFGSKKIEFRFDDDKVENNLRDVKLPVQFSRKISEFLANEDGEDLAVAINSKNKGKLSDHFQFLEAAGGLVFNEDGKVLFIFRRGKWDLPKGKIDAGENPEQAAVREVSEETGLVKPVITQTICDTYHIYPLKGQFILKKTYWFKMKSAGIQKPIPQTEEDITEALWLNAGNIRNVIQNTFPSIIDVMRCSGLTE